MGLLCLRRTEADSRSTSNGASASSLVPCRAPVLLDSPQPPRTPFACPSLPSPRKTRATSSRARREGGEWERSGDSLSSYPVLLLVPPRALKSQHRRARRLVAHTEDGGGDQSTRDNADASSLVLCCLLLPCLTRQRCSPTSSTALVLLDAVKAPRQRAQRLVAHTRDKGGEQTHERRRICVVPRALLPAPAVLLATAIASDHVLHPISPSPSELNSDEPGGSSRRRRVGPERREERHDRR